MKLVEEKNIWNKQGGEERVADNKEYTCWRIGLDQNQEGKKPLGGTTRKLKKPQIFFK